MALFIGRFQPFHEGHLYSLNKCLELADRVIVGIGSSQESGTENNPWDYETRKKMIEKVMREPSLEGSSLQIVAIPDVHDDKKWGVLIKEIIEQAGQQPYQVVGVGNNEWTNRIFRAINIEVYETGLYKRDELEGIKIRTLMRAGDDSWKSRVPKSVVKFLEEYDKPSKD